MRGNNHVVECLDRKYNIWYVIKTFGETREDFVKAIKYVNEVRQKSLQ